MNIGAIHEKCAQDRLLQMQKTIDKDIIGAEYVKTEFSQDGLPSEHMWVKVISIDHTKREVVGAVDNDPHQLTNVYRGYVVTIRFSEISQVLN